MRKLLLLFMLLIGVAQAQYAPTSAKTKFVNALAIGSKDTGTFAPIDTMILTIARDSTMYYRYKGFWKPLATGGNLSSYVPYVGATNNLYLGTHGLYTDAVTFKTSSLTAADSIGRLKWDTTYRTAKLGLGGGNVQLQIGQEQVTLVHNNTGSTLLDGQVVYITGSTGELPSVGLASDTSEARSSVTFGVVTEHINNGADGFITTSGMVHGLNTLAYTEGKAIWLGTTPGTFTDVKPQAPQNAVLIGYVVKRAGGNGSIFVKIQNGYELDELHDVKITAPVRNQSILIYDSTSKLWVDTLLSAVAPTTDTTSLSNRINAKLNISDTASMLSPYARNANVVHLTGTETITGTKTFTGGVNINTNPLLLRKTGLGYGAAIQSTTVGASNSVVPYINMTLENATGGTKSMAISGATLPDGSPNVSYVQYLQDANGTIALTSDITGAINGTINYIPKFTGTNSLGNSAITDNGTTVTLNSRNLTVTDGTQGLIIRPYTNTSGFGAIYASTLTPGNTNFALIADNTSTYLNAVTGGNVYLSIGGAPALTISPTLTASFASSVTATSIIKSGGTSTQYLMADGSVSTLTNPVTGTGTTNYLPKFTGTSTLGNSAVSDDGTTVTINSRAFAALGASFTGNVQTVGSGTSFRASNYTWMGGSGGDYGSVGYNIGYTSTTTTYNYVFTDYASALRFDFGGFKFLTAPSGTAGTAISFTQAMTLTSGGRLLINTTTDDGTNALQVNGSIKGTSATFNTWVLANDGTRQVYLNPAADFGNGALPTVQVASNHALQFATNNTLRLTIASTGAATFSSTIQTAAPSGGTAQPWKLGSVVTALSTLDTGHYIQVEINGTAYKLALMN